MNYWIYIQFFICLSICLYLKGDTKMTQICLTSSASLSTTLAVPQLVRRKPSGRYTVRYRQRGSMMSMLSLGLKTTNRNEAINRMTTITEAAKLFLLDNPKATPKEFNERLKDVAETLLTDDARAYWSHEGDIDTLGDLTGALRSLSLSQLSVAHQVAIRNALEVLQAGSERVQHGDPSALIGVLEGLKDDGDIANNVITNSKDPKATWASIVEDCLAEKRLTIRESSVKDLESSLRTVSKYILEASRASEADFMSRQVWLSVRDAMLADGLAISSVNKFLTKARMVIEYALMNQKVPLGRNPIERIKMREPQGKRKAFSEEQLKALVVASRHLMEPHRRSLVALGAITGARIGELVQLTPSDVVTIDGTVYIDINDNDAKTLKNANSKRLVPLCDGLYGFSLADFMEDVKSLTSTDSTICKVTRDRASKWFNEEFVKATLGDVEGLVFHSFRHAMATQCKAHGVSEVDAGSILGHKSQSITYGLYGKGQALGRLKGALETLKAGHS